MSKEQDFYTGALVIHEGLRDLTAVIDGRLRDLIALLKPDIAESVDGMDQTPTRPAEVALTDADEEFAALRTGVAALIDSDATAGSLRYGLALLIGRAP